jgi:hypothetical protein
MVLGTLPAPESAPFTLIWRRWTRFSGASAGSFTYKVLVGIKGVPAHALSVAVAQQLLGSSCAQVELASSDDDGVADDDGRELFVAAWCVHPTLIAEQKILVIPEPRLPHDAHGFRCLREHEIIHAHLPTLRYLARMRVVEFQDWDAPSSPSDDDDSHGAGDSDDCGNSNCNGDWPGFEGRSGSSFRPATFRQAGANGAPSLGRGSGPTSRPVLVE